MEKEEYDARLSYHDKRDAEHEFNVLGLMANYEHCNKHCNTAAKGREEKKCLLGRAKFNAVFLGYLFVSDADNYRNNGDYRDICYEYRQNRIL